jgi:hypothetical protein
VSAAHLGSGLAASDGPGTVAAAALVVPVRGVPGIGCGALAVHWRPGRLSTSPAKGVRGRAAAGRAAGRHAHPRRAAARRDAAGWACHLVGARLHWLHARSGLREPTEHTPAPGPCAVRMGPSRRPGQRTMARRAAFGWLGRRRRVGQGIRHELGGHGGSTGRPGHTGSPYVAPADRLIPVTPHRRRYASLAAQPAATPVTVATEPPLGRRCLAPDHRPSWGHSCHGNGGET